jgi:hypothetical protein
LSDEETRPIAGGLLDAYEEVPVRSFIMTLAHHRRARETLKNRVAVPA